MTKSNNPLKEVFLAFQVIPRVKDGNNYEVVDKAIEVVKMQMFLFRLVQWKPR